MMSAWNHIYITEMSLYIVRILRNKNRTGCLYSSINFLQNFEKRRGIFGIISLIDIGNMWFAAPMHRGPTHGIWPIMQRDTFSNSFHFLYFYLYQQTIQSFSVYTFLYIQKSEMRLFPVIHGMIFILEPDITSDKICFLSKSFFFCMQSSRYSMPSPKHSDYHYYYYVFLFPILKLNLIYRATKSHVMMYVAVPLLWLCNVCFIYFYCGRFCTVGRYYDFFVHTIVNQYMPLCTKLSCGVRRWRIFLIIFFNMYLTILSYHHVIRRWKALQMSGFLAIGV